MILRYLTNLGWLTIILAFTLHSSSTLAASLDLRFSHLTLQDGLPTESVSNIAQDEQGFLWIGSNNGLIRYDGYSFKHYRNDIENPHSLSNDSIHRVHVDSAGRLWIGTWGGGLQYYDTYLDHFVSVILDQTANAYSPSLYIHDIRSDAYNRVFVATFNGLYQITSASLDSKPSQAMTLVVGSPIRSIALDENNQLFYEQLGDVFHYNLTTDVSEPLVSIGKNINHLFFDRNATRLWIGNEAGLYYYDLNTDYLSNAIISSNVNVTKSFDHPTLMVGTNEGLYLVNSKNLSVQRFNSNSNDALSLLNDSINDLLIDYSGILWAVSYGQGLNKYIPQHQAVSHLPRIAQGDIQAFENGVLAFSQSKTAHQLWLGSKSGLSLYDLDSGTTQIIRPQTNNNCQSTRLEAVEKILHQPTLDLLWLAVGYSGIASFDLKTKSLTCYPLSVRNVRTYAQTLILDVDGTTLWVGSNNGVFRFSTDDFSSIHLSDLIPKSQNIGFGSVYSFYIDQQQALWVAGQILLIKLRPDRQDYTQIIGRKGDVLYGLSRNERITAIIEGSNNFIWLGSNKGLIRLDNNNNSHLRFTRDNAQLIDHSIQSITLDDAQYFWLGTENGLIQFDPINTKPLYQLTVTDGLATNYFKKNSALLTQSGKLILGDAKGAIAINPRLLSKDSSPPKIQLTDISILNESLNIFTDDNNSPLISSAHTVKELVLPYAQAKMVGFTFAAPDFKNPTTTQYRYQLINHDEREIAANSNQRTAIYNNLAPGDYRFIVKASILQDQWSIDAVSLKLTILAPWYLTWWAYLIYFILTLATISAIIIYREYSNRQYQRTLEKEVTEKTHEINQLLINKEQLLTAKTELFHHLSHEFRTPLTLILGHSQRLTYENSLQKKSQGLIESNAKRLVRMVTQLLNLARINHPDELNRPTLQRLDKQLNYIITCFEPLILEKQLSLHFDPPKPIAVVCIEDTLEIVFSNIISNAIKYTPQGGHISIHVEKIMDQYVKVSIKDTGFGMSATDQTRIFDDFYRIKADSQRSIDGVGLGLSLTKKLIEASNGSISVDSTLGQGTTFTIELNCYQGSEDDTLTHQPLKTHLVEREIQAVESELSFKPKPTNNYDRSASDTRKLVLIIDDHEDMLDLIEDALGLSYCYQRAHDAQQGLKQAIEEIPDFIVSDVMMPGEDGFWLCQQLKEDERTSHIPVILLTARADMDSRLEGLSQQANDYITKPFHPQELRLKVQNLLDLSYLIKQKTLNHLHSNDPNPNTDSLSEHAFIKKVDHIIYQHLYEAQFKVSELAQQLHLSERQLHRKLKAIAPFTPKERISELRLEAVRRLLEEQQSVDDIIDKMEFSSENYLTKLFKARYDVTPRQYQKNHQAGLT